MKTMPPKALVTGCTGFIGSHLVEILVSKNWRVTCLLRPESRVEPLQKFPVVIAKGRMNDLQFLEKTVEGQNFVFHLAARIRSAPKRVYDEANHRLTRNLVYACLRNNPDVRRFVYVSSISAGGPSPPGLYSDESLPAAPTSEYGRSKLKGEEAVREVWSQIPATIIRPSNVYGPRQQETELLIKLIKQRIVFILRDKRETTSLIYVEDLIHGLLQAAYSPKTISQTYFLTDGKGYSWREIIFALKQNVLGNSLFIPFPEEIIYFFAMFADVLKSTKIVNLYFGRKIWRAMVRTPWLFSSSKAKKDFGFHAHYALNEGIKETVDYYRLKAIQRKTILPERKSQFHINP